MHLPLPRMIRRPSPLILELDLSQGVVASAPANPFEAFRMRHATSVRSIREGLRRAATDEDVVGLLVHIGTCPLDLAVADEVASLVGDFATEKPTLAWTESFGELSSGLVGYRIAAAAREIWLQPTGALGLTGVQLGITLLRGGLEKLGLEPQFSQRHEYKSAADQFAGTAVTEANREMMQRIADSIVEETVARVAAGRGLDVDDVRAAMAQAPLTAKQAVEHGLVDRLGYRDQVYAWARDQWGQDADLRYLQRYAGDEPAARATHLLGGATRALARRGRPLVAVVDVSGAIVLGPGHVRQAGSESVSARIRQVERNDDVKAVILRVDSPGGSYVASDAIRRDVLGLREGGRPVVAMMGRVAASGGYFVSMPADEIVAQPSTLTGSIGVLAGKLVTEGLIDKVGLVHEPITSGPRAGLMSAAVPFGEEEWQVLEAWLDEVYTDFTAKAAVDRDLPYAELEPLARGRVWTGADAAQHGLVDHLGGTAVALDRVCELAGLDRDDVSLLAPSPLDFLRRLKAPESSESPAAAGIHAPSIGGPEALLTQAAAWAGLPVPAGVLSLPWGISIR